MWSLRCAMSTKAPGNCWNAMRCGTLAWEAIEELSPALRLPLVVRHFTEGVTGYDRIAQVCGVPVGWFAAA